MSQTRFIYLIHFDRPFKHAKHYLGSTNDIETRLREHRSGGSSGARLMAVVKAAGIGWTVARLWRGGRTEERRLKNLGGAARLCPICSPAKHWGEFVPAYQSETAEGQSPIEAAVA